MLWLLNKMEVLWLLGATVLLLITGSIADTIDGKLKLVENPYTVKAVH
jgi:hypothetical protein